MNKKHVTLTLYQVQGQSNVEGRVSLLLYDCECDKLYEYNSLSPALLFTSRTDSSYKSREGSLEINEIKIA